MFIFAGIKWHECIVCHIRTYVRAYIRTKYIRIRLYNSPTVTALVLCPVYVHIPLLCVLCRSSTAPSPRRESPLAFPPPTWSTRRAMKPPMPSSTRLPLRCSGSTRSLSNQSTSPTSSQGPKLTTGELLLYQMECCALYSEIV